MEREQLFKSFGFVKVGGCINTQHGVIIESEWDNTYEIDIWLYVDFKKKRVIVDSGDGSEPTLLKGEFTKKELKIYNKYEYELDEKIFKSIERSDKNVNIENERSEANS